MSSAFAFFFELVTKPCKEEVTRGPIFSDITHIDEQFALFGGSFPKTFF